MESLVGFLRRCSRVQWQAPDLRGVLDFLIMLAYHEKGRAEESSRHANRSGVSKLLTKIAAKARAKFPDNAFFQFTAGTMELTKGPGKCNRRLARQCFERAVQLTQGAADPDGLDLAQRAKEKLLWLDEQDRMPPHAPRPLPFWSADDDLLDRADLPDDDDDDDGDDGGGGRRSSSSRPAGTMFEMFVRLCREAGVDPRKVLDEMEGELPFRFRPEDRPKPIRKNRR